MATRVSVQWIGTRALIARLSAASAIAHGALSAAIYQEGQEMLTEALPITPVDTGNLRASGRVSLPRVSLGGVEVDVGFGGAAAPYALFVHERLDAYHKPPTQAKFLETVALRRAATMGERLRGRLALLRL